MCFLPQNEMGNGSGDAWLQLAAYGEKELDSMGPDLRRLTWPCPLVGLEVVGSHLRVIAIMWAGPGSPFLVRSAALTPLLPFQRLDRAHMEQLARLVCALCSLLPDVRRHYLDAAYPMSSDAWACPPPWPVLKLLKVRGG